MNKRFIFIFIFLTAVLFRTFPADQTELNEQLVKAVNENDIAKVKLLISQGASPDLGYKKDSDVLIETPLVSACKNGYLDIVRLLVEKGADVNLFYPSGLGATLPISYAAEKGNFEIVKYLAEHGAMLDDDKNRLEFKSPLLSGLKYPQIVEYLLKKVADPNGVRREIKGYNMYPIVTAVHEKYYDSIKLLIKYGAYTTVKPFPHDENSVFSMISLVCENQDFTGVKIFVENGASQDEISSGLLSLLYSDPHEKGDAENYKKTGAKGPTEAGFKRVMEISLYLIGSIDDVNRIDKYGKSYLYYAVTCNCPILVEALINRALEKKVKLNIKQELLDDTAKLFRNDLIKLLIKAGADINKSLYPLIDAAVESKNNEMLKFYIDNGLNPNHIYGGWQPILMQFLFNGNFEIAQYLADKGANINGRYPNDNTPLIFESLKRGDVNALNFFIKNKADMSIVDSDKNNIIFYAIKNDKIDFIKILSDSGVNLNYQNDDGKTALMILAGKDRFSDTVYDTFKALVNKGADFNIRDKEGISVLMHALIAENEKMIRLLLEKNADVKLKDNSGKSPMDYAVETKNRNLIELVKSKIN